MIRAARNVALHPQVRRLMRPSLRALSYSFLNEGDLEGWPNPVTNTIINVCPQGQAMVIERLGKLHSIEGSGWFLAIPLIDVIKFKIDMRERALELPALPAITRDNVTVHASGMLYIQFVDAEKAAYGSQNPLYAVRQHAHACMRAAIGEMELDDILHARAKLNLLIKTAVQEAASAWGMEIKRYEITELRPDAEVAKAMDQQAAAERERRQTVLRAEGSKKAKQLESEGLKIMLTNESEGNAVRMKNEAEARKAQLMLEAQGEAEAILTRAKAQAEATQMLAKVLNNPEAMVAAQLQVAGSYIEMYGQMGQKSNTMIFSDKPADIRALLAQAASVLQPIQNANKRDTEGEKNH